MGGVEGGGGGGEDMRAFWAKVAGRVSGPGDWAGLDAREVAVEVEKRFKENGFGFSVPEVEKGF